MCPAVYTFIIVAALHWPGTYIVTGSTYNYTIILVARVVISDLPHLPLSKRLSVCSRRVICNKMITSFCGYRVRPAIYQQVDNNYDPWYLQLQRIDLDGMMFDWVYISVRVT